MESIETGSKIRIMLVDDHAIIRQGLRALLSNESDIEVIGEASNGDEAVRLAQNLRPDIVLMDVMMPRLNGIEAARQIGRHMPSRVIFLSGYAQYYSLREAAKVRAWGYLLKDSSMKELVAVIRKVKSGENPLAAQVAAILTEENLDETVREEHRKLDMLTQREREVLQLIAEGKQNKNIADLMRIHQKTVEKHRQGVMKKLHLHDIAGLTRFAYKHGIISLELMHLP